MILLRLYRPLSIILYRFIVGSLGYLFLSHPCCSLFSLFFQSGSPCLLYLSIEFVLNPGSFIFRILSLYLITLTSGALTLSIGRGFQFVTYFVVLYSCSDFKVCVSSQDSSYYIQSFYKRLKGNFKTFLYISKFFPSPSSMSSLILFYDGSPFRLHTRFQTPVWNLSTFVEPLFSRLIQIPLVLFEEFTPL